MPSKHFILCHPLLLLPSIFPSIRVFSNGTVRLETTQPHLQATNSRGTGSGQIQSISGLRNCRESCDEPSVCHSWSALLCHQLDSANPEELPNPSQCIWAIKQDRGAICYFVFLLIFLFPLFLLFLLCPLSLWEW